ncbi:MAG: Molybdate/tungstate import ATP-binding protein WtpC [Euryarchaeota archaeon ADurb.BinA087]|nr:MAG: Molybdate/tungstate import ATP-binding protein WtpC [Euryarchaeota archaeon ADurb.BinA087]
MIAVEEISLTRGDFSFAGISLQVPESSYTVLMGPSGAGKTLLLESIGGFLPVTGGRILVAGRDVTMLPPEKRGIGFMYQDYSLFPHLTVEENIAYGLKMKGIASRERTSTVKTLLSSFSLHTLASRHTGSLSGGEKQRVALVRALATRPTALLLDEPFAALDPEARLSCMDEVKAIQKDHGLTILQVSHDRDEAYRLADQVVVMDNGRILQTGTPAAIFSHPVHPTVAAVAGFENILEGTSGSSEGGRTRLSIGTGTIIADRIVPAGDRILACIRSRDITLAGADIPLSEQVNRIDGQVISMVATDHGCQVRFVGPFPLLIDIPGDRASWEYRPGEQVVAWVAPKDVHLIRIPKNTGDGGNAL